MDDVDRDRRDASLMRRAIANAATARLRAAPNPWVGAVLVDTAGVVHDGATRPPGGAHAERVAIESAGASAAGATLYSTLEPCAHQGRTGPCTEAIIAAGVARVVVGLEDPDPQVAGGGVAALRSAGLEVELGVEADAVERQLAPYITHRRTGRPHVILKLALTLDGRIAAPDGSSKWITGSESRADAHRLRAMSDSIVVGAGTARTDSPSLTVRAFRTAEVDADAPPLDPWRIVLGAAPADGTSTPYEYWPGPLEALLDDLGGRGHVQLLVEGGAAVAASFHRGGFVDEYWFYVAPAIMGGDDGLAAFTGPGAPTMAALTRGRFVDVDRLGDDVRLVFVRNRA